MTTLKACAPTTADVERNFKASGDIITRNRLNMSPELFEALMIIKVHGPEDLKRYPWEVALENWKQCIDWETAKRNVAEVTDKV